MNNCHWLVISPCFFQHDCLCMENLDPAAQHHLVSPLFLLHVHHPTVHATPPWHFSLFWFYSDRKLHIPLVYYHLIDHLYRQRPLFKTKKGPGPDPSIEIFRLDLSITTQETQRLTHIGETKKPPFNPATPRHTSRTHQLGPNLLFKLLRAWRGRGQGGAQQQLPIQRNIRRKAPRANSCPLGDSDGSSLGSRS